VFVLIDENESASTTFAPNSPAPYLSKTLVADGAYLWTYYRVGHASLDNYIAMVSGQAPNPDTSGDCPTFSNFGSPSLTAGGQESGEGCVYPSNVSSLMTSYSDTGAGTTVFTIVRKSAGYMTGRSTCKALKPGQKRPKKSRGCTALTVIDVFGHADNAGANSVAFTGSVRGKALAAGTYLLEATPALDGASGSTVTVGFRVT
jgi:hypothetical protein